MLYMSVSISTAYFMRLTELSSACGKARLGLSSLVTQRKQENISLIKEDDLNYTGEQTLALP